MEDRAILSAYLSSLSLSVALFYIMSVKVKDWVNTASLCANRIINRRLNSIEKDAKALRKKMNYIDSKVIDASYIKR